MVRSLYKSFHNSHASIAKRLFLSACEGPILANEVLLLRLSKRLLRSPCDGEGHGIIILPGFLGTDGYNQSLIDFLNSKGYAASGWMNGTNTGPKDLHERMKREIEFKVKHTGNKITLIGHSLGGIYARELARKNPELIERVITLGSPFSGGTGDSTVAGKLYWATNKNEPVSFETEELELAPQVPVSSVFTRGDCIIDWRTALQIDGHAQSENIEVYGSHCGLTLNPAVWYLLLDRLAQSSDNWKKFDNSGWRSSVFPLAQLAN